MKKRMAAILTALLAAAALAAGLWLWLRPRTAGHTALVTVAGAQSFTVPLDKDNEIHIDTAALPVTLEVKGGKIRFINSQCPDGLCEGFGWLSDEGSQAICMPAGVVVTVQGGA